MAGLFGLEDPEQQGLLSAALAMLAASGPSKNRTSVGQIVGIGGAQGLESYNAARLMKQRDEELKRRNLIADMQIRKAQQQLDEEQQVSDIAKRHLLNRSQMALSGGGGPTPEAADLLSKLPQNASSFDQQGFTNELFGVNPLMALKMQAEMRAQRKPIIAGNAVLDPDTFKPLYEPPVKSSGTESEAERLIRKINDPSTSRAELPFLQQRLNILTTRAPNEQMLLKIQTQNEAKGRVSGNLEALHDAYRELESVGGAIRTGGNVLENAINYGMATGPGQIVGNALGTRTQQARNRIGQLRPLLIQDIRQASQMGAKGLDSNAELNFYLQAATDPTRDIDSNLAALEVLDRAYGLGIGIASKKSARDKLREELGASGAADGGWSIKPKN